MSSSECRDRRSRLSDDGTLKIDRSFENFLPRGRLRLYSGNLNSLSSPASGRFPNRCGQNFWHSRFFGTPLQIRLFDVARID